MDSIVARRTFWELVEEEDAGAPARRARSFSDSELYSWTERSTLTDVVEEKHDSCCSGSTVDTLSTTGSVEDRWSEESTASESGDISEDSASVCAEQPGEVAQFHPQQAMFSPCVMVPCNHMVVPQAWAYPAAVGLESRARALHHAAATLQAQVQAASATAKPKRKPATKRADDKIAKIAPSQRTTILMKNLHSSVTRSALLRLLDSAGFSCKYDFVYLPFKLVPNAEVQAIFGYAIVNFCSAADASAAMECLRGVQIESQAVITEWSESQQGHDVLVQRYRDSPVMHQSMPEEYQPILLLNGARIKFPAPTRPLQPPRKFAEKK